MKPFFPLTLSFIQDLYFPADFYCQEFKDVCVRGIRNGRLHSQNCLRACVLASLVAGCERLCVEWMMADGDAGQGFCVGCGWWYGLGKAHLWEEGILCCKLQGFGTKCRMKYITLRRLHYTDMAVRTFTILVYQITHVIYLVSIIVRNSCSRTFAVIIQCTTSVFGDESRQIQKII